jgi:hypothetical protein
MRRIDFAPAKVSANEQDRRIGRVTSTLLERTAKALDDLANADEDSALLVLHRKAWAMSMIGELLGEVRDATYCASRGETTTVIDDPVQAVAVVSSDALRSIWA